jgi:hypothetical protein
MNVELLVFILIFIVIAGYIGYSSLLIIRKQSAEITELKKLLSTAQFDLNNLAARAMKAERTRHELVLAARYALEAGGEHVSNYDQLRGEHIQRVGHALPYMLSGCRDWGHPDPSYTEDEIKQVNIMARTFGFELPPKIEPEAAVKAMLELAIVLFNPKITIPLETLQIRYPARAVTDAIEEPI